MKHRLFTLHPANRPSGSRIVPNDGETLAIHLVNLADSLDAIRPKAAILHLAADAYVTAADASLGHNRAERYMLAAKKIRERAELIGDTYSS